MRKWKADSFEEDVLRVKDESSVGGGMRVEFRKRR